MSTVANTTDSSASATIRIDSDGKRIFTPKNNTEPINLDLSYYKEPVTSKVYLKFAYFYAVLAIICIIGLLCKDVIAFCNQYKILFEVMAAILLFLSAKTCMMYLRRENKHFKWEVAPARITRIVEQPTGESLIDVELLTEEQKVITFRNEFRFAAINAVQELGINALPVRYQPAHLASGKYYIDIKFQNGQLDTSNLKIKQQTLNEQTNSVDNI